MKRLEEIKNEISILKGFNSFEDVFKFACNAQINDISNESAKKYAEECVKTSLQKASENVIEDVCIYDKYGEEDYCKNKEVQDSINSNSNIVLL